MNPIPYPPQLNFPPPPIMAPIPLGVPPPYSVPPPSAVTPLAQAPSAMWTAAPQVQANIVNIPMPTIQCAGDPAVPPQVLMVIAGGAPDLMPPPGSAQGSVMGFDNMSI